MAELVAGRRNPWALAAFVALMLGGGTATGVLTGPDAWYAALAKPPFNPPNWIFAPVWTALYILMAFAGWRAWKKTGLRSPEMAAFAIQLALNLGWSILFFGLHRIGAALIEIIVLDVAILATLILFFRRDRVAGLLLLPYLAWTLFATLLTQTFGQLNQ